jgi:zinc/manganese transport system substrate-binding protein
VVSRSGGFAAELPFFAQPIARWLLLAESGPGAPGFERQLPLPSWGQVLERLAGEGLQRLVVLGGAQLAASLLTAEVRGQVGALAARFAEASEWNAAALEARLEDLGKWVRLQIVQLPKKNRVLVTSHDALGYFAKDYGFEILPVQGISTSDQPSSQKVRDLIGRIQERGVKAIFAESIENPKVLGQITAETGAKLGGVIYADGLGSGETGTYEGMMRHNVTTIVEALK